MNEELNTAILRMVSKMDGNSTPLFVKKFVNFCVSNNSKIILELDSLEFEIPYLEAWKENRKNLKEYYRKQLKEKTKEGLTILEYDVDEAMGEAVVLEAEQLAKFTMWKKKTTVDEKGYEEGLFLFQREDFFFVICESCGWNTETKEITDYGPLADGRVAAGCGSIHFGPSLDACFYYEDWIEVLALALAFEKAFCPQKWGPDGKPNPSW